VAQISSVLFSCQFVVILAIISLVIFWTFYALRRGAPSGAILLIQMPFCFVPILRAIDKELSDRFCDDLVWGFIVAMVAVVVAHVLFPSPLPANKVAASRQKPSALEPAHAARVALTDTIVLLPLLIAFIRGGDSNNIVILMIMLSLLRAIEPEVSGRMALGILTANILGGALAVVVHQFLILTQQNFLQFILLVLAMSLWFGSRIAWGGDRAPIYATAFMTFLLILGLGIAPLFDSSEELYFVRILKIAIASLYTIGALSLLMPLRQERATDRAKTASNGDH
jgi:hypothetical protein